MKDTQVGFSDSGRQDGMNGGDMPRLRIGVVGPLTGARSAYGDLIRHAIEDLGHCPELDLRLIDDQAQPEVARRLAAEIAADVDIVVGHFNSDCARAAIPLYRVAGVPLLLPASTDPELSDGVSVFRLCADEPREAAVIVDLWQRAFQDLALHAWTDGSPYGGRLLQRLEAEIGRRIPEAPPPTHPAKGGRCVVVYLGSHVAILQRMREEGPEWRGVSICCDDCHIEEFESQARLGAWVCAPQPDYRQLLQHAIDIAHKVLYLRTYRWSDFFDAQGQSLRATWRLYRVGESAVCAA